MLLQIKYILRGLFHDRGAISIALLSIGFGIGATVLVFSIVDATLLKSSRFFKDPKSLAVLRQKDDHGFTSIGASWLTFRDWTAYQHSFTGLAAFQSLGYTFSGGSEPQQVVGARISEEALRVLGVEPILGRGFSSDEHASGSDQVFLAAYSLWRDQMGADRGAIGRVYHIDGIPRVLVGVMPPGFVFPESRKKTLIWVPLVPNAHEAQNRSYNDLFVLGRLRPGVTFTVAQAEMSRVEARLTGQYPESGDFHTVLASSFLNDEHFGNGNLRPVLRILGGVVALVLLIACANVASLLFARHEGRRREVAVRYALGASSLRIVRGFLFESLVISALGGAIGLGLVYLALPPTLHLLHVPFWADVRIDAKLILFTGLVCAACAVLFGAGPALAASRWSVAPLLREGSAGSMGGRRLAKLAHVCVAVEIALASALLAGTTTAGRSLIQLLRIHPGFETKDRLTFSTQLPPSRYPKDEDRLRLYRELLRRLQELPRVQAVSLSATLPLHSEFTGQFAPPGIAAPAPSDFLPVSFFICSPKYLPILQIPVLAGRNFESQDETGKADLILINRQLAQRYWHTPSEAVGQWLFADGSRHMIIGEVDDTPTSQLQGSVMPAIYFPYWQSPEPSVYFVIQSPARAADLSPAVREAVASVDNELAISTLQPLSSVFDDSLGPSETIGSVLAGFTVFALLLAFAGIYGVVSYAVARRTREIALRRALGASTGRLLKNLTQQTLAVGLVGIAVGGGLSLLLIRLMSSTLYGVKGLTPAVTVITVLVILLILMIAAVVPARRALRADDMCSILRRE